MNILVTGANGFIGKNLVSHLQEVENVDIITYDIEDDLGKITSKVLIISCTQDPHFPPELDGVPMSRMIKDSQLIIMDSQLGHLCFNELENISDELSDFMKNFGV